MPTTLPITKRPDAVDETVPRYVEFSEGIAYERTSQGFQEVISRKPLPMQLLKRYTDRAMKRAQVKPLDDGTWYAWVPDLTGVWANEPSVKESIEGLEDVLLHWLLLKIVDGDRDLPVLDGIDLNVL